MLKHLTVSKSPLYVRQKHMTLPRDQLDGENTISQMMYAVEIDLVVAKSSFEEVYSDRSTRICPMSWWT
jgi:hypothetical protein